MLEYIHTVHWIVFVVLAVAHGWLWYRRGFHVPQYVHAIALGALATGIGVNFLFWPIANPEPLAQFAFPFIFPGILVVATYVIAIFGGFLDYAEWGRRDSSAQRKYVRIVRLPDGIAPESVRRAWIGLVLPLAPGFNRPVNLRSTGIAGALWSYLRLISFELTRWPTGGVYYLVSVSDALAALEKKDADAASWWKSHWGNPASAALVFQFPVSDCEAETDAS